MYNIINPNEVNIKNLNSIIIITYYEYNLTNLSSWSLSINVLFINNKRLKVLDYQSVLIVCIFGFKTENIYFT